MSQGPEIRVPCFSFPLKGGKRPRERQLSWWVVGGSPSFPGSAALLLASIVSFRGLINPAAVGRENQEGREGYSFPHRPGELLETAIAASRQKDKTCSLEDSLRHSPSKEDTQVWRGFCPEVLERMAYFLQGDRPNLTPDLSKSHRLAQSAMPHTWVGPQAGRPGHSALLGPQCSHSVLGTMITGLGGVRGSHQVHRKYKLRN